LSNKVDIGVRSSFRRLQERKEDVLTDHNR
jgi:hypothetical protein